MRVIALDIGEKRVGIAAGNTETSIASPVCVLPLEEVVANARSFRYVIEDHEPELLLCGRPYTLAGEVGAQAERVEKIARELAEKLDLPLAFQDERLSSKEAKTILRAQGLDEKKMRGRIDSVAASLFLEAWLKSRED